MSLTLDIPPEDHDRLLDERARSLDAGEKRWWLLCRKFHLSKKLETDDSQFDLGGLAKSLSEVMARDRGDKDVPQLSRHEQHYLRDDRKQEQKLASERRLEIKRQEMEKLLKEQLCANFSPFGSCKFSYDDLIEAEDLSGLAQVVARAAHRAQKCYMGGKDQEDHLKSLWRLVRDLGRAIADCDSIQDYLSISTLLFWSAKDVLDLTIRLANPRVTGVGVLESIVRNFFRHYVASVLLVESGAKIVSEYLMT